MLTDEKLQKILKATDLPTLIQEYVPLSKQGKRMVGLCPFHQETKPSFGVGKGQAFYYCFGCQASGDAVAFLRHVDGLGYQESVCLLAIRAGIEPPKFEDWQEMAARRCFDNHMRETTEYLDQRRHEDAFAADLVAALQKSMPANAFRGLIKHVTDISLERAAKEKMRQKVAASVERTKLERLGRLWLMEHGPEAEPV